MMKQEQPSRSGYSRATRLFLYSVATLGLVGGGVVGLTTSGVLEAPSRVEASEIKNGVQIGTLNNVPVIKSSTSDMASDAFQDLVDSLLADADLSHVKYVADSIQWNANTQVKGVNGVTAGSLRTVIGTNIGLQLAADGAELELNQVENYFETLINHTVFFRDGKHVD